jgi:GxxExxY protein
VSLLGTSGRQITPTEQNEMMNDEYSDKIITQVQDWQLKELIRLVQKLVSVIEKKAGQAPTNEALVARSPSSPSEKSSLSALRNSVQPGSRGTERIPAAQPGPHGSTGQMRHWPDPELEAITYRINGCAMAVHNELGSGLREDTYQRAMEHALAQAKLFFVAQPAIEVHETAAGGRLLGYYIPDLLVEGAVVVELKALAQLEKRHLTQVIGYLAVTGCPVGLLFNFGERALRWRRILPPHALGLQRINRQWLFTPSTLHPGSGDRPTPPP